MRIFHLAPYSPLWPSMTAKCNGVLPEIMIKIKMNAEIKCFISLIFCRVQLSNYASIPLKKFAMKLGPEIALGRAVNSKGKLCH